MKTFVQGMLVVGTALLLGACTMAKVPPVSSLPETGVAFPEKESYIIGPSDVLEVNVWKEPDLTRQAEVRMDGKITLPMINDLQAENQTLMELQEKIEEEYAKFVTEPEVTVILVQSNSRRVYMLGKVNAPGEYPLKKSMTFLQAVSIANGLDRWADKDNIRLIRKIEGQEQTFRIDYDAIVSGKDLSQNILLQPEDTIFVP
ncbi:MAG: polysaccharide biosynthesis/export family protein [Desulfobacteraceae bacterium]|jgi:polysaccharide export outer membrane protein